MNIFRQIVIVGIAVFYLIISTGIVLYKTHCECSSSDQISLFAVPETCSDLIPDHQCCSSEVVCDKCSQIHEEHSCGCNEPIVSYFKLTDHVGEDAGIEYTLQKYLKQFYFPEQVFIAAIESSDEPAVFPEYTPPPNPLFGRFLLNYLNQRKIALLS